MKFSSLALRLRLAPIAPADDPAAATGPDAMRPPREPFDSRPRRPRKTSRVAKAGKGRRRGR